ncbi:MAG TPA: hypothetical protein VFC18_01220 [Burkholderiales bacterium]|nr:hypothetical protein [Burkholderiales bacterium]
MARFDKRGNPVAFGSGQAIDALDRACDLLHAYQADPLAEVDRIIAEHPDFAMAHAFRAGALATATDKAFEPDLAKSVEAAERLGDRELADTFVAERLSWKPQSPVNRAWAARAGRLAPRPAA